MSWSERGVVLLLPDCPGGDCSQTTACSAVLAFLSGIGHFSSLRNPVMHQINAGIPGKGRNLIAMPFLRGQF